MSNVIFQNVIIQLKDAIGRPVGVIDDQGYVAACSELAVIGSRVDDLKLKDLAGGQAVVAGKRTYVPLNSENGRFSYAAFVEGTDAATRTLCTVAAVAFNEAKGNYEEKHNRTAFVKNIISDNILPGDVYVRAKELHFMTDVLRGVFLIRQVEKSDIAAAEVVQNMFPDRQRDFVISISESDLVLIKELDANAEREDLMKIASSISETLSSELLVKTVIGIGTPAKHLRELADRYKEAQTAIEVGKVFENERDIISYENLGIGRIIYQLPTTLCEMFLSEVFKKNPIESLDQETLYTINKFFENNLNVSETSRKLFVHRNTLVYRLEKIKKITGLDLREFDHAIVFKVALMVKKYLNSQNVKY